MKKKNHVKSQRIFNLIILDESGSMQTIERQAVSGLNETFQTIINAQKENHEQRHFISLNCDEQTACRCFKEVKLERL